MQKPIPLEAPTGVEYLSSYAQYRQALQEYCLETPVREELQVWKKALPQLRQKQRMRAYASTKNDDLSSCLA